MALGAMTVVEAAKAPGPIRHDVISLAGESSYVTGGTVIGDALNTALGIKGYKPLAVVAVDCAGYIPALDIATGKLKVYRGDNANGAAAPAVEVAAAVNLSAVTFVIMVISH